MRSAPFVLAFSIQEIILSKLGFIWLTAELNVTAAMRMSLMGGNWLIKLVELTKLIR